MKKLICYCLILTAIVLISCSDTGVNTGTNENVTDFAYPTIGNNLISIKFTNGSKYSTRCFLAQTSGVTTIIVSLRNGGYTFYSLDTISEITVTKLTAPYTFWFRRSEGNNVLNSECCSQVKYANQEFSVKVGDRIITYPCGPLSVFNFVDTCLVN